MYLTRRGKVATIFATCGVLLILLLLGTVFGYCTTDRREFINTYSVHTARAENFADASMIKQSLEYSLDGIEELGLVPYDSYRVIWFIRTEYSTVQTHILETQSVIKACDQVILWLEDMHGESVTKEIGADIYNEKVKNLQILVDHLDDRQYRVERAWMIKYRRQWLPMYWLHYITLLFYGSVAVISVTGNNTWRTHVSMNYNETSEKYRERRKEAYEKRKAEHKLWIW